MKAAVLEEVKKLIIRDVPEPEPGPSQVLVKVAACGICGTDIKLYEGKYSANVPVILGHEYSGEVIKTGNKVTEIKQGDKIVPDPNESCGACYWCRSARPCFCNKLAAYGVLKDGGFAEFALVGEKGAYKIPEGLDYESASFAEPVSCAVHCIDRASIKPGETVLIIGGGAMGQILVQLARDSGAGKLIMVTRSRWKLELAKKFGATDTVCAEENTDEQVLSLTEGLGADVVIEAVGSPQTIELAIRLARKSGRVVIFGFAPEGEKANFIPFDVLSRELTIMGSWVNPYTFSRSLDILSAGKIDVKSLVSLKLSLGNIMDGFRAMKEKPEGFMKAMVMFKKEN